MADKTASPRQKMINMMYLVLTALLALNVSAEILKAFHLVETSMSRAGENIDKKNQETYKAIVKYKSDHPTDPIAIEAEQKSKAAMTISSDAVKYFQDIKDQLISLTGGRKEDSNGDGKQDDEEIVGASNTEIHANLMIVQKKGEEVKAKINKVRDDLMALVPKDKQGEIKSDLYTLDPPESEGKKVSWESEMFEHTPLAAVNTLLTKIQNDIKNTESQVLNYWKSNLTGDVIVIDNFEAQIIPTNGTYISQGSKFTADIFLAAASSKTDATVTVGGSSIKMENGIGKYDVPASGEGEKKFKAVITTKRASGKTETYEKEFAYTVVKPIAVISATKMNVVYIGLENPISVSVPGYAASEVLTSIEPSSAGQLKKDPATGGYLLTVNGTASQIKVVCSVKDRGTNATKKMGEANYRVRKVPDPIPALGTLDVSGGVSGSVLKIQNVVRAPLKGFAFEGVNYVPFAFEFLVIPKRGQPFFEAGKGQQLSGTMQAQLARVVKGDKVMITNIKVKGPDGNRQLPSPIVFDVQ
ncbi:MAG: gliding motility protein GldM [Bacteroidia bacterium]|jgi:gliding motility-associated protein GldM|nr:gliding motility protein GldM [Bacteroidia bacterium]